MEVIEIKTRTEFNIGVNCLPEMYNGEKYVYVLLIVDYIKKTYEIIPPKILIETNCRFPVFVAKAIELAYDKAIQELYW